MRVLAWSTIQEFLDGGHDRAEDDFRLWFRKVEKADWSNFADLRRDFRSADAVGPWVVFDVMGDEYRLIAWLSYRHRRVLVKFVGTHRDCDKFKTRADFERYLT